MSIPYQFRQLTNQWLFDIAGPLHITGTAVLLPFIQRDYGLPETTVAWALVIYFLGTSSFILAAAYLGNALGRKRLVIIGVSLDLISQISLFFMGPFVGIVVLRGIGGIGNSMVVANLSPITVASFGPDKRGKALGLMAIGLGFGIMITPVIAGVTAETLGWRYLFLFSGFLYAVLLAGVLLMVKESTDLTREKVTIRRFDYPGLILVTTFLVSLTLGMQRLGTGDSPAIGLTLFGISILMLITFVRVQLRSKFPLIIPSLFRQRSFSIAIVRQLAFTMMRASYTFLLPFYFIQGLGWSGAFSGSVLVALNAGQFLFGPISGYLSDKIGTGILIWTAFFAMVFGTLYIVFIGENPSVVKVVIGLLIIGAAHGLFAPPNLRNIYDQIPDSHLSLAPGVAAFTGHGSNAIGSSMAAMLLGVFLAGGYTSAFQSSIMLVLCGFIFAVFILFIFTKFTNSTQINRRG